MSQINCLSIPHPPSIDHVVVSCDTAQRPTLPACCSLPSMNRPVSPVPSDASTTTNSSCESCPPWPESHSVISHLALNSGLDEIPNNPEGAGLATILAGGHINRKQRKGPNPRITTEPALFVYYRTGTYGPQFGYRLLLVKQGNNVDSVERWTNARGPIEPDTSEMLVFPANGRDMLVVPEKETSLSEGNRAVIDLVIDLPLFQTLSANTPNVILDHLRQNDCRTPTSELTLRSLPLKITYGSRDAHRLLLFPGSRNSPEKIQKEVLDWIGREGIANGGPVCLAFGRKGGKMEVYS